MTKVIRQFIVILSLFMVTAASPGCIPLIVGAAAGAGGYAWVRGALVKEFDVPAETLSSASIRAIKQLNLSLEEEKTDRLSGYIRAKLADKQKVVISIKALTEKKSEVRIRIGVFGDQAKSEMVLNGIKKNL
jgi:hypothetical protein